MRKEGAVRTSVDLPRDLHRRLHEEAARRGTSARQLILASIEKSLSEGQPQRPKRRLSLDIPIVSLPEATVDFSNEELYDLIDFP